MTLAELAIEPFFPADAVTAEARIEFSELEILAALVPHAEKEVFRSDLHAHSSEAMPLVPMKLGPSGPTTFQTHEGSALALTLHPSRPVPPLESPELANSVTDGHGLDTTKAAENLEAHGPTVSRAQSGREIYSASVEAAARPR